MVLVDEQENESVVALVEPSDVDNVYIPWVCTVRGDTTFVIGVVVAKSCTYSTSAIGGKESSQETTYGLIVDQCLGNIK